ncbi:MAG: transglycosylase domain-containing protein [Parvibaculaceae bacterium]
MAFGSNGGRKRKGGERVEPRLLAADAPLRGPIPRSRRGKAPKPRRKRRRSILLRLFSLAFVLVLAGGLVGAGGLAYVYSGLEAQGVFQVPEREPGIMLVSADGQVLAERGSFFGDEVRLDEMPGYLPQAIIAIEDRRFYSHYGIDPMGLGRAALANFSAGRVVQGGSTLTQQLAKNLFLKPERTYERKAQELVLALWLENRYTKDEILQLYLNRVFFGGGAVGVEKAAQRFFGKSARDVTLSEATILASVLKAPTYYNPINHPDRARERAQLVLDNMVDAGFVTTEEAKRAANIQTTFRSTNYQPATHYVVDWVAEQIPELIGKLDTSIIVETTIDRNLEQLAERALAQRLDKEGGKLGISQAALVVMDTQGGVKAMIGGRSYAKSQFNRAIKAKRQPGSSFKPFVYLTALEQGMTPDSMVLDEPITIGDWSPENYKRKYLGAVSMRKALALSLNTVAARLAVQVGPKNVIDTAHRLGIASNLVDNASIALGTSEVTVLEMAAAFAPFANGGNAVTPYVVTRITSRDGKVLYERKGDGLGQVMNLWEVGAMNDMLRAVVQTGTGTAAQVPGHDIAGKTGTSQEYRDSWFVGYSAQLIAAVWAGNDDNSPTKRVTGGSIPAAIWTDVMGPAHASLMPVPLPGDMAPSYQPEVPMAQDYEEQPRQRQAREDGGLFGIFSGMFGGQRSSASEQPEQGQRTFRKDVGNR